jgi:uncharacterized protein (TIGR02996 family)
MSVEGALLLQAALDSPDDEAVRLVYADWLEEQGDTDGAAFMRRRDGEYWLKYLSVLDLQARGWTRGMIRRFLGRADCTFPVNHFRNFRGKDLWLRLRVLAAEATPAFQEYERRWAGRRAERRLGKKTA